MVNIVRVDGCVLRNVTTCDWMMVPNDNLLEYYIELKGSDVERAIQQLVATMKELSRNLKTAAKRCFVISARSPLVSADIQRISFKFRREYNATLLIRRIAHEVSIEE